MYHCPHPANNSCYNCGQPGHISRDCTEKRENNSNNNNRGGRSDTKCYGCGGYGHMARACPSGINDAIQREPKPKADATTVGKKVIFRGNVLRRTPKTTEKKAEGKATTTSQASATSATRWVILPGSALVLECLCR